MPESTPSGGFAPPSLASQQGEACPGAASHPSKGAGRKLRILLVEDHAPTLAIISLLLERDGYEVTPADSMAEALSHASGTRFDLLISDLSLPDGTGSDLLREIRQKAQDFPAIAMTGYSEQEDLSTTRAAGFCMHLVKPVDLPELREAIRQATSE